MSEGIDVVADAMIRRKVPKAPYKRDARYRYHNLPRTMEDVGSDTALEIQGNNSDLQPGSLMELLKEIDRYKNGDPRKDILLKELERLRSYMQPESQPYQGPTPDMREPWIQRPVFQPGPARPRPPMSDTPGGIRRLPNIPVNPFMYNNPMPGGTVYPPQTGVRG